MAGNGNVIPFPAGVTSGIGAAEAPQQQSGESAPVVQLPTVAGLQTRMAAMLHALRETTVKLISRAEPGTVELGLFNQFGILQNTLAQLQARLTNAEELQTVADELETAEKAAGEYIMAVDQALANMPSASADEAAAKRKKLLLIGGAIVGVAALGAGAYFVLRKPSRRRKLAGLFGFTAATPKALGRGAEEPVRRPRRRPRRAKAAAAAAAKSKPKKAKKK